MSTRQFDQQPEGFHLMQYVSDDGNEVEYIWNSRDAVTPFVVMSRLGTELHHVDWPGGRYRPNFRPQPGSRIFVDMTAERAREYAIARVERMWEQYGEGSGMTKEETIQAVFESIYQPGTPDIQVVGEEWKP